MTVNHTNPKVDWFFSKAEKWQVELAKLRKIVLGCQLTEELKWGVPCYTHQNSNIVLIHAFKDYCALLIFNGALLKDASGILVQQTKNVQAGRQIRFTSVREIGEMAPIVKAYLEEAIEVEKAGLKVAIEKDRRIQHFRRIPKQTGRNPGLGSRLLCIDTWSAKRLFALFCSAKTIQNPGVTN